MLFIFDGGQLDANQLASINFQDGEVAEYAFVEAERLDQLTIPRLACRIRATLDASAGQLPAYLEDGDPQPQTPSLNM